MGKNRLSHRAADGLAPRGHGLGGVLSVSEIVWWDGSRSLETTGARETDTVISGVAAFDSESACVRHVLAPQVGQAAPKNTLRASGREGTELRHRPALWDLFSAGRCARIVLVDCRVADNLRGRRSAARPLTFCSYTRISYLPAPSSEISKIPPGFQSCVAKRCGKHPDPDPCMYARGAHSIPAQIQYPGFPLRFGLFLCT